MPFTEFPYTNFHELNLDFILKVVKELQGKTDRIDAAVLLAEASAQSAANSAAILQDFITTPEMFGGIGDGITDDSAAVQEALVKGSVILLKNNYLIRDKITSSKSNIMIIGPGTLTLNTDNTSQEFTCEFTGSNIGIYNVHFKVPTYADLNNNSSQNGVKISHCKNVTVEDCVFDAINTRINGLLDFYEEWENITVKNCVFNIDTEYNSSTHVGGVWIRSFNDVACYNAVIDGCKFNHHSSDEALAVWNAHSKIITDVKLLNCSFDGTGMPHLITMASCINPIISNCSFAGTPTTSFIKSYYNTTNNDNLIIKGCIFQPTNGCYLIYILTGTNEQLLDSVIKGTSARDTNLILNNCDVTLTANANAFNSCTFKNCKMVITQTSNQLFRNNTRLYNCVFTLDGTGIQTLADSANVEVLNNLITINSGTLFSGRRGVKFVIKNNVFKGSVAPNFGSFISTDVVMNNLSELSPSWPNPRPIGADSGDNTNLVG